MNKIQREIQDRELKVEGLFDYLSNHKIARFWWDLDISGKKMGDGKFFLIFHKACHIFDRPSPEYFIKQEQYFEIVLRTPSGKKRTANQINIQILEQYEAKKQMLLELMPEEKEKYILNQQITPTTTTRKVML